MLNCYKVYMHTFPNRKKYIGSTSTSLQQRWNNGKGYYFQSRIFDAICKYGWNNVNHYLLFDGLTEVEAKLIENALIHKFQTHKKTYGYNTKVSAPADNFVIPPYKRKKIKCSEVDECLRTYVNPPKRKPSAVARAVMIVETGEIFESVSDAARAFMITPASINYALRKQTLCCDYHWQYITLKQNERIV